MKGQNPQKKQSIYTGQLYRDALLEALKKFAPRKMVRNPVMFVVEVVSILTTGFWIQALLGKGEAPAGFIGHISLWLWFTVLFANYAEALAEGRGKAQAAALRRMRKQTQAKLLPREYHVEGKPKPDSKDYSVAASTELRKGDLYFVETGDILPADGEIVEGIASVDESAVTGESAPVAARLTDDRCALPRNGALVHRRNPLHDLPVRRKDVARLYEV